MWFRNLIVSRSTKYIHLDSIKFFFSPFKLQAQSVWGKLTENVWSGSEPTVHSNIPHADWRQHHEVCQTARRCLLPVQGRYWVFCCDARFFSCFNRKFHGYSSLKEYYEKESCVHYIHNVRTAPVTPCFSPSVCFCICVLCVEICAATYRWMCHCCW